MGKRRFEKKKDVLSVSHVGLDKENDGIKKAFFSNSTICIFNFIKADSKKNILVEADSNDEHARSRSQYRKNMQKDNLKSSDSRVEWLDLCINVTLICFVTEAKVTL